MENSNSRTVIKEHKGIRQNYHNMPDRAGYNRVCILSRNGDRIRLTYSRTWDPVSVTVNHDGKLSTTGAGEDSEYFEDLEQQIAAGLIEADRKQAEKEKEEAKEKALMKAEQAREWTEERDHEREKKESRRKAKAKNQKQCTLLEPFAVQRGATA